MTKRLSKADFDSSPTLILYKLTAAGSVARQNKLIAIEISY
jgi:hypothetical protein